MKVKIIVAVDQEFGIGKDNDLMWHLPEDMRFFKETTSGQIIISGRKNYISIPEKFRPLPNRENIVLTRDKNFQEKHPQLFIANSWENVNNFVNQLIAKNPKEVYIIGGGEIYRQALDLLEVEEMWITHVHHTFSAEVFFPEIDHNRWQKVSESHFPEKEKRAYSFSICKYIPRK
ncbi:MAG: dihydrofolate reductase [Flavobacteriales bacterium]|jgi:dihydrofolate reductase|nr:dihydrofolate reductase [Flavobacteriales bacterium]